MLPEELVHIILEYDGRIKYRKGEYVNIIHKHDERYGIITPLISKKMVILKHIELDYSNVQPNAEPNAEPNAQPNAQPNAEPNAQPNAQPNTGFYFSFNFNTLTAVGLVYDNNFSYTNKFEICYFDFRNNGIKQIRTYI